MIDEESRLPVEIEPASDRYGEGLLYDYSKFVTTLALFSLGGVVTLTQAGDAADVKLWKLGLVIVSISLGGVLALTTASGVVDARTVGKEPSRRLPRQLKVALGLIALGLGAFLQMWWEILR